MGAIEYEFTILDTKVICDPLAPPDQMYFLPLIEGANYRTPWYEEYGNL